MPPTQHSTSSVHVLWHARARIPSTGPAMATSVQSPRSRVFSVKDTSQSAMGKFPKPPVRCSCCVFCSTLVPHAQDQGARAADALAMALFCCIPCPRRPRTGCHRCEHSLPCHKAHQPHTHTLFPPPLTLVRWLPAPRQHVLICGCLCPADAAAVGKRERL